LIFAQIALKIIIPSGPAADVLKGLEKGAGTTANLLLKRKRKCPAPTKLPQSLGPPPD
jgi:hypothetical protein